MPLVASSEYDLLTLARAIAVPGGQHAFESVEPIIRDKRKLAGGIGPTAMGLLKQTLARGVVLQLVHRGGWRDVRHIRKGETRGGRLWERAAPLPLRFGPASIRLIRWLATEPLGQRSCGALELKDELLLGDELVLYLTLDLLAGTDCGESLGAQAVVKRSPLVWLAFPELVTPPRAEITPERFKSLVDGPMSVVVEALQGDLARRWDLVEAFKRQIDRLARMRELGETQERLLDAFLTAADRAGRRDLADFALEGAVRIFSAPVPAVRWTGSLDKAAALSERAAAHRAAGAFLRSLERWRTWDAEHRGVRFFDDGYQSAQLLLGRYERAAQAVERAAQVARELESLTSFQQGAQS